MVQRVEGLSIDLDLNTAGLDRGLKGAKDRLKTVNSEMKANMSAFDRADQSIEKYETRLQGLNKKLKAQERVTNEARKEYERMVEKHGEGTKEAEKAAREYNNQAAALNNLDRYVKKATEELEEMRREQARAESRLGKLSKSLNTFADGMDKAGDKMTSFGQTMSTRVTAPIIGLGAAAVETTRDFRVNIARLETNARQAGLGVDVLHKTMRELNGITGETDSNVEALSNLLATGMNETQLQKAVENLSGAVIKFPDTLKIESLADGLQETVATGKAVGPFAELLERMGEDLETFDEGLAEASESGEGLNYVLDKLNDLDLSKVNREFRKTNKSLVEAREEQYDFQQSFAKLGEKLEPIATKLTERVTDIIDAFNALEPETQDNIIKFAGLAAALGPVGIALGGVTTTIGNLAKGASRLTDILGSRRAGGKGLLGRLVGLSRGGVVGLAIGGIGALAYGISQLGKEQQKLNEVSLETAEKLFEQHEATSQMIDEYDNLRNQSKLSNDEFARYLDLQSELQSTSDPGVIEDIKSEMEDLQKNSGLSNDQLNRMVELNGNLTDTLPGATDKITDQGNKLAGTTDELRKYNEEFNKMAMLELESEFYDALENQEKHAEKLKKEQKLLNALKERETEISSLLNSYSSTELEALKEKVEKELSALEARQAGVRSGTEEWKTYQKQIEPLREKYNYIKEGEKGLKEQLLAVKQDIVEKEKSIQKTKEQQKQLEIVLERLEKQHLLNAGISEEKAAQVVRDGQSIDLLDRRIQKLQQEKETLKEQTPVNERNTVEYQEQVNKIDNQISKLQTAKSNIEALEEDARRYTDELGRDVNKNVKVDDNGSAQQVHREATKSGKKEVGVRWFNWRGFSVRDLVPSSISVGIKWIGKALGFAQGTDYHPGGISWLGEEGPELVKHDNKWALAGFGLYDVPRGARVYTHDETKRILSALKNVPGYASGASPPGDVNRMISKLNHQNQTSTSNQKIVLNIDLTNTMDGRLVGKVVEQYVTEIQQRKQVRSEQFAR